MDTGSLDLENRKLKAAIRTLKQSYDDLNLVHQGAIEHSTGLENELEENNRRMKSYMERMKKYLSSQLFQKITGTEGEDSLSNNQRKRLTIFFSDIVGFSKITDSVEPEVLSTCLNYYLDRMSKIALKYDGTIDKFIGDAIMMFFGDTDEGTPEDHAKKCVKMALEMQEEMKWVNEFWIKSGISQAVQIRIGINSGYTTVGNYGTTERMDYTIIGGQVNIAARLEAYAEAGQIVIADSTKELVNDEIETKFIGDINVKGVHMPLKVHVAVGLKEGKLNRKTKYLFHNEDDGFILDKLVYNKQTTDPEEKKIIQVSLQEALQSLGH